ncbi:hypothetical protein T484DRAFT_1781108 [Baffinella frigidus]|nr:hypothetical protein T484DRAFT_1781108 [Cryptophyta sp. CCMP2293]
MAHGTDQEAGAHGVAPQSEPLRSRRPALVASALALATVVLVVSSGNSGGVGLGLQQSLWGWAAPVKPSLPAEFDVRWGNGNCRGFSPLSIANAGKCNAGHALLLSAMLSARACMSSRAFDIRLAPQSILDCYPGGEGCLKPSFETALKMLATQDIPDEQCHPLAPFEPEGYVASPDNCATDMCHGALRYAVKPASILHAVATFPATAGKVDPTADAWVLHYNEEPALPTSVEALMAMVHAGPNP